MNCRSLPSFLIVAALLLAAGLPAGAQTPPIQPTVQETPLPPPVQLPAPPVPSGAAPERPVTVDEAVRIALANQPDVAAARAGLDAARGRTRQARAGLLPGLVAGASYTNANRSAAASSGTGTSSGSTTFDGYQWSASVRQLLYDFNHTRDLVQKARSEEISSGAGLTRVQADLVLRVKQVFYAALQMRRLVEVQESNVKSQQTHGAEARARLNAGVGTPADVVRAEAAVAESVLDLTVARNAASQALVDLAGEMGLDPRTPLSLSESSQTSVPPAGLNDLVEMAMSRRPEVLQARHEVEAARHALSAAKTSNAPSLGASVGWQQRGQDFPPDDDTVTYGVSLQWSAFDSGLTRGRVAEAAANVDAAAAAEKSVRLAVTAEVSRAFLDVKTAEQRMAASEASVANATEALRLIEGRYRAGLGTFVDVLDAQTAAVTARTNQVNARSALDQSLAALDRATGESFAAGAPG